MLQGFKFKTLWYHSNNYNQGLDLNININPQIQSMVIIKIEHNIIYLVQGPWNSKYENFFFFKNVIIDMRAMLNNAVKGEYMAVTDPSVSLPLLY